MEDFLNRLSNHLSLSQVYIKLLVLLAIATSSYLLSKGLFGIIKKLIRKKIILSIELIDIKFKIASAILISIIILNLCLPAFRFSYPGAYYLKKLLFIGFVFSIAFVLIKLSEFARDWIYLKQSVHDQPFDASDNLNNRKIRTQIGFLQKVVALFIILIACSIVLMSFTRVREIGTSLIASAGIAGVIVGIAAQKSLANLLAGLQIAVTQPIRIDDIVVVESERGKIEEITLTYVVVKIWDERRMVLPISYFIEKPFENWTRTSSELIGSVFLYVDYSVSVEHLRQEMMRIVKSTPLWDGRVARLQVVECTDKSIKLRGILSAANFPDSWDLKCLVMEKLISHISDTYPEALPVIRSKE